MENQNTISKLYNRLNEFLKHLFKPFPILLGLIVSLIEINDYMTPDPMEQVIMQIEESQRALNDLKVVDIPDSLQTDLVKEARLLQQRLIAYAKIINSCNAVNSTDADVLTWQMMRFNAVIEASKAINDSMTDFIVKLGYDHRKELDMSVMYIPNIYFKDDNLDKLLDETIENLSDVKTQDKKLKIANEFVASKDIRDFLKHKNTLIRSAFEYLNIVQLSLVYNLDMANLSHITNGK